MHLSLWNEIIIITHKYIHIYTHTCLYMDNKITGRIYHHILAMTFCSSEITRHLYCLLFLVNYTFPYFSSNFTSLGIFFLSPI